MKIQVEIISEEIIKPSSPTPQHLHRHQLSFLDQLAPRCYTPFIYFYDSTTTTTTTIAQTSKALKTSLSEVLTRYYPLAGRVKNGLFVHCNDQGIPFFEARVKSGKLSDLIANPVLPELNTLLPFELGEVTETALGVQLNVFECGGFAIGICLSHQIADALSFFTFVKNWAGTANSSAQVSPDFSAASIFPPRNLDGYSGVVTTSKREIVIKKFVFDMPKVEALRSRYAEKMRYSKTRKFPSRIEALSDFLWKIFVLSRPRVPGDRTLYTVVYIMDLRSRFDHPLPQLAFGNYYRAVNATPISVAGECDGMVRQAVHEIEGIGNGYMTKFQDGYKDHLDFMRKRMEREAKGELVTLTFSSLCKFPMYEADFGWGRPAWVGMAAMNIKNQISFLDTKNGDGIECYFRFKEEDMAKFELDKGFIALLQSPIGNVKENPISRL